MTREEAEKETTEVLEALQESLYDDMVNGDNDAWFSYDVIVQELIWRRGHPK